MRSDLNEKQTAWKAAKELATCAEILFDRAPVMMHMIDGGDKLVKVNHRWSQTLGYKRREAAGRWSIEFLTEESRDAPSRRRCLFSGGSAPLVAWGTHS